MLVDEVEIEEPVNISHGRYVAHWMTGTRIAQPGKNVPRSRDDQEQQQTGGQTELPPPAPISGEPQIRQGRQEKEDRRHQSFSQHGQPQCRPGQVKPRGFLIFQSNEKIVESKGQQQGQQNFRDEDAGEKKNTYARQDAKGGVERSPVSVGAAAPGPGQESKTKHPKR